MNIRKLVYYFVFLATLPTAGASFADTTPDPQTNHINKIVMFGDSGSDNGNDFRMIKSVAHQGLPGWPYMYGRFSEGETWIENLAYGYFNLDHDANPAFDPLEHPELTLLENTRKNAEADFIDYAYGGAWAEKFSNDHIHRYLNERWHGLPFDLNTQIQMYLKKSVAKNPAYDASHTLFFVWIGGNDYIHHTRGGTEAADNHAVAQVITSIQSGIETLIKPVNHHGAGAKNIILLNIPDLSKTPWGRAESTRLQSELAYLSQQTNQQLAVLTQALRTHYPMVQFRLIDINTQYNDIRQNPQKYALSNVVDECVSTPTNQLWTVPMDPFLQSISLSLNAKATLHCHNSNSYMFFDHIHPTEHVHRILAQMVCENLQADDHGQPGYQYLSTFSGYQPLRCPDLGIAKYPLA